MFVVLFEVQPKRSQWDRYLQLAGMLRPELERVPGFVENVRYESERTAGKLLSLSTWESEKALVRWRTHALHHDAQRQGRFEIFDDYHLRVGEVVTDTDHSDIPQTRLDVTEIGLAIAATVTEIPTDDDEFESPPLSGECIDAELYVAINDAPARLLLAHWKDADAATEWIARRPVGSRHRQVRIIRDYGLGDRTEAPQYYPDLGDVPTST
ncbi:MAG TPA: antibiotic biosynthesis monooxygenase [Solirubrobacteraceae bacterium]